MRLQNSSVYPLVSQMSENSTTSIEPRRKNDVPNSLSMIDAARAYFFGVKNAWPSILQFIIMVILRVTFMRGPSSSYTRLPLWQSGARRAGHERHLGRRI